MRRESNRPGPASMGGWFHGGDSDRVDWRDQIPIRPASAPRRTPPPITPEMRDQVFGAWAAEAGLSREHRQQLRDRGFPDTYIDANGNASHPPGRIDRRRIATRLVEQFGPETMAQIPGFCYREERNGERQPHLSGPPGLLIPARPDGVHTQAFQVRSDKRGSGPRYMWISSRDQPGGTGSGAPLHIAYANGDGPGQAVDIAALGEGPLKGDLTALTQNITAIALPGVSTQSALPATLRALRVKQINITFDADADTNRTVLLARDKAATTAAALGCDVQLTTWDTTIGPDGKPDPKGIDDAIRAGVPLTIAAYPFRHAHGVVQIPEVISSPPAQPDLRDLDAVRRAHQAAIDERLERCKPGFLNLRSATGSGKTHSAATALISRRITKRWPRVPDGKGGERRARAIYLAQTKEQVAAFVNLCDGRATTIEGRNPDAQHRWGCHRFPRIRAAGEGRHNPTVEVCKSCREEYEAVHGAGWLCNYLQSKAAAESSELVAAPVGSFLNGSSEIDQFDIVIVDENIVPALLERVVLTPSRVREWSQRMDALGWIADHPFRRLITILSVALAQHDAAAKEWTPATVKLCEIDASFPDLIDTLMGIAPSKQTHHYDFEKPANDTDGPIFPLRAARDLIEVFAAELDRPPDADVRLWLTRDGLQLYLPREHLVRILRTKTVVNLDATPSPLLRRLFPDLEEIDLPIPTALHVTQVRDALATRASLAGQDNRLRDRFAAALDAITRDAESPVIFTHKALNPEVSEESPCFRVSNPNAQYGHFDRETRSLNRFSDTDLLAIVGRYSAPINDLRAQVQAVRWSEQPPRPRPNSKALLPYAYRAPDGSGLARWTETDPDPDVDALIRWSEASTILQAIGRGRAALRTPGHPLRVVLFTNLPIPGLPIDRIVTLADLGAPSSRRGDNTAFREAQQRCLERNAAMASDTERLVANAIARLCAGNRSVTFSGVAQLSGVRRQTLYENPVLRVMVEQHHERDTPIRRTVPPGTPNRYISSVPGGTVNVIDRAPSLRVAKVRPVLIPPMPVDVLAQGPPGPLSPTSSAVHLAAGD